MNNSTLFVFFIVVAFAACSFAQDDCTKEKDAVKALEGEIKQAKADIKKKGKECGGLKKDAAKAKKDLKGATEEDEKDLQAAYDDAVKALETCEGEEKKMKDGLKKPGQKLKGAKKDLAKCEKALKA